MFIKRDNMHECFDTLNKKVHLAIETTDLNNIFNIFSSLKEPTLVVGTGGSSIVATFLSKVLREKNNIISTFTFPRDIKYMNLSGYKNIVVVSYSGKNSGVDAAFDNNLNKYLFTGHPREDTNNIVYKMANENSYVSINATITPITLIALYYKNDINLINEILDTNIKVDSNNNRYEVMYGYETQTAAMCLESSFTESSMASCILHEKYNFAHGRLNIARNMQSDLIYFKSENDYDNVLSLQLKELYKNIITIDKKYDDDIINDYYSSIISLKLIKSIADNKKCSISEIDEYPANAVLYGYNGKI